MKKKPVINDAKEVRVPVGFPQSVHTAMRHYCVDARIPVRAFVLEAVEEALKRRNVTI